MTKTDTAPPPHPQWTDQRISHSPAEIVPGGQGSHPVSSEPIALDGGGGE
jgi:hypothetical protein